MGSIWLFLIIQREAPLYEKWPVYLGIAQTTFDPSVKHPNQEIAHLNMGENVLQTIRLSVHNPQLKKARPKYARHFS